MSAGQLALLLLRGRTLIVLVLLVIVFSLISSELAEVIAMADRVLVMAKGQITAEFTAADVTEEALVRASASDTVLEELA